MYIYSYSPASRTDPFLSRPCIGRLRAHEPFCANTDLRQPSRPQGTPPVGRAPLLRHQLHPLGIWRTNLKLAARLLATRGVGPLWLRGCVRWASVVWLAGAFTYA